MLYDPVGGVNALKGQYNGNQGQAHWGAASNL